jgi:hypothetical protein
MIASPPRRLGYPIRLLAATLAAGLVALAAAGQSGGRAAAAEPLTVDWGIPSASATFGSGIVLTQAIGSGLRARAELLVGYPDALGPLVIEVSPDPTTLLGTRLRYELKESDGHIVPNTTIHARWRVVGEDGRTALGPDVAVTYADTRFDWRTKTGDLVRVHWYEGSSAFGDRALAIGEQAIANAAKLLGVTETEPVDFFIYAGQKAFYDALGPGTRENVGGEAHADIRTMFALITPAEIGASWVGVVVPHELTHLVFDTAVRNPYHFPPRWLNEGLAVYLSEGYGDSWRAAVDEAARSSAIIPLDGLTGQFPTTRDRFFLAYGESVSAVDFLVRTYGRAALVKLIRSYADGVSDDEAFRAALGSGSGGSGPDVAAFQAAWIRDLGAVTPTAYGPRPAPAGPLPSGWSASPGTPLATAAPAATPPSATPPPTGGAPGGGGGDPTTAATVGLLLGGTAVGGLVLVARLRRRRSRGA